MVVGVLTGPGTEETTANDEERDSEAEIEDWPSLAEALLLHEILLVCHSDGGVGIDGEGAIEIWRGEVCRGRVGGKLPMSDDLTCLKRVRKKGAKVEFLNFCQCAVHLPGLRHGKA